jgi:hypothetical protein
MLMCSSIVTSSPFALKMTLQPFTLRQMFKGSANNSLWPVMGVRQTAARMIAVDAMAKDGSDKSSFTRKLVGPAVQNAMTDASSGIHGNKGSP